MPNRRGLSKPAKKASDDDSKLAANSKKIKKTPKDTKPKKTTKTEKAQKEKTEKKEKAPSKKKVTKETKANPKGGYTADQKAKYNELKDELGSKTNDQLKEMLRKNDQATTGTKKELIEKVADGKVLGKIPRCPNCFGGRPKFNPATGMYNCPGYHDDERFRFCKKKYTMEELPRETWED